METLGRVRGVPEGLLGGPRGLVIRGCFQGC